MCTLMCGHYCLEHTMQWLAKQVCTGANLSMVCVYPHRYGLSHVYFTQEKYSFAESYASKALHGYQQVQLHCLYTSGTGEWALGSMGT